MAVGRLFHIVVVLSAWVLTGCHCTERNGSSSMGIEVTISGVNDGILPLQPGSKLELNCTSVGNFHHPLELIWTDEHERVLDNTQKLDSRTVQLVIKEVTKQDSGIIWCGVINQTDKEVTFLAMKNVTLLVGDLPSKPYALRWEYIDIRFYKFHIYWQVAQAGFARPVEYSVEVCVVDSCFIPKDCIRMECTSVHQQHYEFDCYVEDLKQNFCKRNVSVMARNAIGEVRADSVGVTDDPLATPLAPLLLSATYHSQGQIIVNWKGRAVWLLRKDSIYELIIIIVHAKGGANKTRHFNIKESHAILDMIEPYQTYHIYLHVQLVGADVKSAFSPFIGPEVVHTPEGVPSPPKVLSDSSQKFPEDDTLRNVTIVWATLSQNAWQGKPKEIQVLYSTVQTAENNDTEKQQREKTITQEMKLSTETVLERLNSRDQYRIHLKSCNGKHCSPLGEVYMIQQAPGSFHGESSSHPRTITPKWILMIVGVGVVVTLITLLVATCFVRKKLGQRRQHEMTSGETVLDDFDVRPDVCYDEVHSFQNIKSVYDYVISQHADNLEA